ncbi:MAG: YbfB/YjiJ family MFS transporter [Betaproteobacteria bacterium]
MASDVRVALAGLAALALAQGIGRFAFTPLLPMMQGDAGLSVSQGGVLASSNYLGYLVGALWAMRPVPPVPAVRVSLAAVALSTLAMAFVQGMTAWIVLRFVAGFASAWTLVHVSSWCLGRFAARPGSALPGVLFTGVGTGVVLAGLVCLALASAGASSAQAWMALGIIALLLAASVLPVFREANVAAGRQAWARLVWDREAARLVLCYTAYGFSYIIPATFVPAMAKAIVADPKVFGWMWPFFGTTAIVSTLVAGRWLATLGARKVWILSQLVMAAGVAAPLVFPGLAGLAAAAIFVGGSFVVITLAALQVARELYGAAAPPLMAAMTAGFGLGQVAGPLFVAHLGDRGIPIALAGSAVLVAASGLALGWKEKPCIT